MGATQITLHYDSQCTTCGRHLSAGKQAWYQNKATYCLDHRPGITADRPVISAVPGGPADPRENYLSAGDGQQNAQHQIYLISQALADITHRLERLKGELAKPEEE